MNKQSVFIQRTSRLSSQFIRYTFVGGIAFVVDASLLFALTRYLGVHYLISAAFGFCMGLALNYTLSILWVFDRRSIENKFKEFAIFTLIGIVGLGFNEVFLWLFTEFCAFHFMISKFFATIFVYLWNFFVRRYLLFR